MSSPTTNFLQSSSFLLSIPKFQNVQFYGQSVAIPNISLNNATVGTPFVNIPLAGDKADFAPLTVNFIIDANMANYLEIFNWIKSIGFIDDNADFTHYTGKNKSQTLGEQDISLMIMSSKNNLIKTILFHDSIPINLSTIELTSQDTTTNYTYGSVTFAYSYYDFV